MNPAGRDSRAGFGRSGSPGWTRGVVNAAVATLAAWGCYSHQPLSTPVPSPQTRIVAEVTDVGRTMLGNAIGAGATEVEGLVVTADTGTWTLALLRVGYRAGPDATWNREQVTFPRSALSDPRERTLNRRKSWLAAGIITVGAVLAARLFGAFGFGEGGDGEPEPPL